MNALHLFLVSWLLADGFLDQVCIDAGAEGVEVVPENERTNAAYPRIVLGVMSGKQQGYSDEELELFVVEGRVHFEIVCRKSVACPDPYATAQSIVAQIQDIVLGRKSKSFPGIKGREFSDGSGAYECIRCEQGTPTGKLPSDPALERYRLTFDVTVQRTEE